MCPIGPNALSAAQRTEFDRGYGYRRAPETRVRIRALTVLLAAEREVVATEIAALVW